MMGGVARRAWARNPNAMATVKEFNTSHVESYHTEPYLVEEAIIKNIFNRKWMSIFHREIELLLVKYPYI